MNEYIDDAFDSYITYKYRGWVMLTTFRKDPDKNEPFDCEVDFDDPDLYVARKNAFRWYKETLAGILREGKFFLPFESPEKFILGKHAAYSLTLSIIECSGEDEDEYTILGESEDIIMERREVEQMALLKYEIQSINNK